MKKFNLICFHLVDHCNLHCKGCFHYAPLVTSPYFRSLEQHKKEIIRLSELINNNPIRILLLGGEPLLHPQVKEFCIITRQYFPKDEIMLVTNGLLLPKMDQAFFDTINNNNIIIKLSDYHLNENIKNILTEKVHSYRLINRGKMLNLSLNLNGTTAEENYKICKNINGFACANIRDGYLYQCGFIAYFDYFEKYFNLKLKDAELIKNGINIFTSNLEEIEQYLNNPIPFCKYCNAQYKTTNKSCLYDWQKSNYQIEEWVKQKEK